MQLATQSSTNLSIPGNNTFSLNSFFVFTISWCPSCAKITTLLCRHSSMTIRVPLNRVLPALAVGYSVLIRAKTLKVSISIPSVDSTTCHFPLLNAEITACGVVSSYVATNISSCVRAFGTAFVNIWLIYSFATFSSLLDYLLVLLGWDSRLRCLH